MKNIFIMMMLVLLAVPAMAEDKAHPAIDPKKMKMMKKWQEAATPGPPHKVLEPMAGSWKYTSRFWETADGKPEESNGTSTFKMILGGRYLQHDTKGKAMGMPFQGLGFTGYNNISGKYESLW